MTRLLGVAVVLLGLAGGGCGSSAEEQRDDYCAAVEEQGARLTRISDEGGPGGFIEALPVLEELAGQAPADLRDEWRTFLDALRGLRDALSETGLDPDDVTADGLPDGLSQQERRRVSGAASVLARDDVRSATVGIEQHALDVCSTPLL
ncbi:hypothetical protein [Nocardioides donggukensis]|uniref:Lipoprotein n=1 Tax=Nocardioides donggukensis TaxID=2774019 RepID=A0A927K4J8_9ACTN|nr:hypothetical protein [Nocardioides donggukensis]MBD8869736.1 hypothetical protein [Nocardioides donggukensis]